MPNRECTAGRGEIQTRTEIMLQVKSLAKQYRKMTGRPLGCTGEIAEYEAVRILDLELSPVRQPGYDAEERIGSARRRMQIKGRCVLPGARQAQRIGRIDQDKEWDAVLLVLLDENLDAYEIYEAERNAVVDALEAPGSKSRNERGALSVSKFKAIGELRWSRSGGHR